MRFPQPDPIRFKARDVNLYRYVSNNPVNKVDPMGLFPWPGNPQPPAGGIPDIPNPPDVYDEAHAAEKKNFPGRLDPYGGAYRHCVAACLLKKRYGPLIGHLGRKIWDAMNEDPSSANSRGDMAGEDAGEKAANSDGSCECECRKKYP